MTKPSTNAASLRPGYAVDLSDWVILGAGVHCKEDRIEDEFSGRSYPFTGVGHFVLTRLQAGSTFHSLTESVVAEFGVEEDLARRDLSKLIRHADSLALLRIRRPLKSRLRHWLTILLLGRFGSPGPPPGRRYPPTPLGVVRASSRAILPFLVLGVVIGLYYILLVAGKDPFESVDDGTMLQLALDVLEGIALLAVVGCSIVIHELGHVAALRHFRVRLRLVVTRGLRVTLRHDTAPSTPTRRVIALSGPVAAAAVAAALAAAATALSAPIFGQAALAIGVMHLAGGLLPFSADGRALWSGDVAHP